MKRKKVILLVGLPGAGKSFYIKNYISSHAHEKIIVCSADHFFEKSGKYEFDPTKLPVAHNECFSKFENALGAGTDTIFVDNTNIIHGHRDKYIKEANSYGYEVFLKVFPVDIELSAGRNVHGVPLHALQRMASQIDLSPGDYKVEFNGNFYKLIPISTAAVEAVVKSLFTL